MSYKDFRDYLDDLEKEGLLIRVKKEVDVCFEIAAGIRKISDTNGPSLLFENIKGYPGWQVAGGQFATPKLMAFALETEEKEEKLVERYLEFDQGCVKPVLVSSGPVKDIIIKGDDVDLTKLPIPTYCEHDAGPYLTAGVEIMKHPVTGIQNASIHRRMILGKDKTSLLIPPMGHPGLIAQAYEEQGENAGIATVLGPHPALTIASVVKAPMGVDEIEIAGALSSKPFELVKCETIDVEVPADAEIVIEGIIISGERVACGPFGEYPGNYITMGNWGLSNGQPTVNTYVVKVTAITMRKNAIFQAMLSGMPLTENHCLKKWSLAAALYRKLVEIVPYPQDIRGINLTTGGTAHRHVIVSIHKKAESTPRDIIRTVLSSSLFFGRVTVVDEDIDIYDPVEVEWAIATRVKPDRDVMIIQPVDAQPEAVVNMPTDHYKWGIDATAPRTREPWLYKKAVPPGVDKVDYV